MSTLFLRVLLAVWLCPDCNRPRPYCNGGCGEGR